MNIEQGTGNFELVSSVSEINSEKKYNLNERLIDFSVQIIKVTESVFQTKAGMYVADQLVRSGTAPALQYGEAQGAESRNDFIHKVKILTKELRESLNALKIIQRVPLTKETELVESAMTECNELISIFVKSVQTARLNNVKKVK